MIDRKTVKVLNIEGLDGVGKTTVIEALKNELLKTSLNVFNIGMYDFPNYENSPIMKDILYGNIIGDPVAIDPYTMGAFYAMDRQNTLRVAEVMMEQDDINLFNRSYLSNFFFQGAKYTRKNESLFAGLLMNYIKFQIKTEIIDTPLNKYAKEISNVYLYHPNDLTRRKLIGDRRGEKDKHEVNLVYQSEVSEFSDWATSKSGQLDIKRAIDGLRELNKDENEFYGRYTLDEIFNYYRFIKVPCSGDNSELFTPNEIAKDIIRRIEEESGVIL
jgi:hypothetical protein